MMFVLSSHPEQGTSRREKDPVMKKIQIVLFLLLATVGESQTKTIISLGSLIGKKTIKEHIMRTAKVRNPKLFELLNKDPDCLEMMQLVFHITKSTKPVILKFYADWYTPCRAMNKTIEQVAKQFKDQISIVTIDIDTYKQVASLFDIKYIPTMIFFKNGKEIMRANTMNEQEMIKSIKTKLF